MYLKYCIALFFSLTVSTFGNLDEATQVFAEGNPRPIVMWHGMGDTCCFPFSLGAIKKFFEKEIPNVYVKSLQIGGNIVLDYESGFFIHPNKQINYVCKELKKDALLANGFNAVGFSQGGQFLRAVAQRCPELQMKVLISIGGQHQGVFGLPKCPSLKASTCEYIRYVLNYAAYEDWAQQKLVQATYWHDPLNETVFWQKSTFLADINSGKKEYAKNLNLLEKFVMVKFLNDTIVQPKDSQWFEFYKPGQDKEILPLKQSKIYDATGLAQMDIDDKLHFLEVESDHLQVTEKWLKDHLIPFLKPTHNTN